MTGRTEVRLLVLKTGVYDVPYSVRLPSSITTTRYSIIGRTSMQCFQTTLNHSKENWIFSIYMINRHKHPYLEPGNWPELNWGTNIVFVAVFPLSFSCSPAGVTQSFPLLQWSLGIFLLVFKRGSLNFSRLFLLL